MTDEVIIRVEGRVGRLTLNRPGALHALTHDMCRAMLAALVDWHGDPEVELVLIDHAGPRGFCAGGDVRRAASDASAAERFFHTEYRLNHLLFAYDKPTVCLMDGVVMGGGAGLALPDYRVGTERLTFAMPEASIGLFPDVGGGWWLSRLPGGIGMWLALTSARLGAADCLAAGVATDVIRSEDVDEFRERLLADPAGVEGLLTELEIDPGRPPAAEHRDQIDHHFGQDSVEAVLASLETDPSDWAGAQIAAIHGKSPQALKIAHRLLREGKVRARFADELAIEHRIAVRAALSHDFREGVRALLVDKDGTPRWEPQTLEAMSDERVDAFFAPLATEREWTPLT